MTRKPTQPQTLALAAILSDEYNPTGQPILSSRWALEGQRVVCHRTYSQTKTEMYQIRPDGTIQPV